MEPAEGELPVFEIDPRLLVVAVGVYGKRVVAVADGERRGEELVRGDEAAALDLVQPPGLIPIWRMTDCECRAIGRRKQAQHLMPTLVHARIAEAETFECNVASFGKQPISALPILAACLPPLRLAGNE